MARVRGGALRCPEAAIKKLMTDSRGIVGSVSKQPPPNCRLWSENTTVVVKCNLCHLLFPSLDCGSIFHGVIEGCPRCNSCST